MPAQRATHDIFRSHNRPLIGHICVPVGEALALALALAQLVNLSLQSVKVLNTTYSVCTQKGEVGAILALGYQHLRENHLYLHQCPMSISTTIVDSEFN